MNKRGFSLIEVTVAAVIFSVSIAGVFASISAMQRPVDTSSKKVIAGQLAKKVLENLRDKVKAPIAGVAEFTAGAHNGLTDAAFPLYSYDYFVTWQANGVMKVDVTVHTP